MSGYQNLGSHNGAVDESSHLECNVVVVAGFSNSPYASANLHSVTSQIT